MNKQSQDCAGCNQTGDTLSELAAVQKLKDLSGWVILEKAGIPQLTKTYTFKNFVQAQAFANLIGELAEEENHYPAVLIEWGATTLYWWTHRLKGLTNLDFEMAAASDLVFNSQQPLSHS